MVLNFYGWECGLGPWATVHTKMIFTYFFGFLKFGQFWLAKLSLSHLFIGQAFWQISALLFPSSIFLFAKQIFLVTLQKNNFCFASFNLFPWVHSEVLTRKAKAVESFHGLAPWAFLEEIFPIFIFIFTRHFRKGQKKVNLETVQ